MTDVDDLHPSLRIAVYIGRVAAAGAELDNALTQLVDGLAGPPSPEHLAGQLPAPPDRHDNRLARIRRKQFAQKLDLCELMWPDSWEDPADYVSAMREAAQRRNLTAHSHPEWDMQAQLDASRDIFEGVPPDVPMPLAPREWGLMDIRTRKLRPFDPVELESIVSFITPLCATTNSLAISARDNRFGVVNASRRLDWYRDNPKAFSSGGMTFLIQMPPDSFS